MTSIIFTSLLMVLINSNGSKLSSIISQIPHTPALKMYKGAGYLIIVTGRPQPTGLFVWKPFVDPVDILYFHFTAAFTI